MHHPVYLNVIYVPIYLVICKTSSILISFHCVIKTNNYNNSNNIGAST